AIAAPVDGAELAEDQMDQWHGDGKTGHEQLLADVGVWSMVDEWSGGRGTARGHGTESRRVEIAPSTAGTMASSTNEGSVHATSGNASFTGSDRASTSARRRRSARASVASRSSTGPSGSPYRSAVAIESANSEA